MLGSNLLLALRSSGHDPPLLLTLLAYQGVHRRRAGSPREIIVGRNVRSREAAQIVERLQRRERLIGGVLQSMQFAEGARMRDQRGRLVIVLAHRLHGAAHEVTRSYELAVVPSVMVLTLLAPKMPGGSGATPDPTRQIRSISAPIAPASAVRSTGQST